MLRKTRAREGPENRLQRNLALGNVFVGLVVFCTWVPRHLQRRKAVIFHDESMKGTLVRHDQEIMELEGLR